MNLPKHSFKILGLCGLVLGVVVLGTTAVHAEKGANWMVNGKPVTKELSPEVLMAKVATGDMTLLTKFAGMSIELLCQGAEFLGAKLEPEGKVGGGNKVKFGGCEMKLNGKVNKACTPHTKGSAEGVLLSNALKGLIVLNEGKGVVLFEPVEGTTFLTLEFGEACALGESCAIFGKNSIKDSKNELGTELVAHTVEQGPIAELFFVSKTAEHQATVDGQGVLELTGAHKGLKWSGIPG